MTQFIAFYTTKAGRFGFTTTNSRIVDGGEIVTFNEATKHIITCVAATKVNYAYAKKIITAARQDSERFTRLLKLNAGLFA